METILGHQLAPGWVGAAVAIGNFDGVHVGHRALIARARELAAAHDARAVVLTRHPHPVAVLSPQSAPPMLASLQRRLELLEAPGVDAVVLEPFTRELAGLAPHAFIENVVLRALNARAIIVGYDFSYGAHRAGTTEMLRAQAG